MPFTILTLCNKANFEKERLRQKKLMTILAHSLLHKFQRKVFCKWLESHVIVSSTPPSQFMTLHTTLYGSAAGCRSIQKTCAFWKNGLTFENTQSQLTYFCKSNINQTFTNGNGMIWGVMIAIFTEIRNLVEELITFLYFFGPQKLSILTARLNKSLLISTSNSMRGD